MNQFYRRFQSGGLLQHQRDRKKSFRFFFSNYVRSEVEFFGLSGIDCTKPFFEIRPRTSFFELISILVHIQTILYIIVYIIQLAMVKNFHEFWKTDFPDIVPLGRKNSPRNSKSARKSVFPVEFRKTVWHNRFLREAIN